MRSNKPYVPLDPALIEQARQIDLLTYLRDCEPSNLVKVNKCVLYRRTRQPKDF